MADHSLMTAAHRPFAAVCADPTARTAATGFPRGEGGAIIPFAAADLYKEVLQLSDNSRWILTDDSPITWVSSGGGGGDATGASGSFSFSGDITPAQITSTQKDYNPTGLSTAAVLRLSTDALRARSLAWLAVPMVA